MSLLRLVLKEVFNLPPTGQELRADQNYLNQQATDLIPLIPWTDKEIDIVSIKYHKASTRSKSLDELGHLVSIYHEPILAHAAKFYRRQRDVSLRVIFTEKDRFTYLQQKGEIKMYHETRLIGRLKNEAYLFAPKKKGALLRFIRGDEPYGVILRGDEAVAQVISPLKADSQNPRAVILLSSLSSEMMIVFKAYTFYLLMKELTTE